MAAALALAACGALMPAPSRAEEAEPPLPAWYLGPYVGLAQNSPGGERWGQTPDRNHFFLGVRGSAPVVRWGWFSLAYAPEVIPVIIVTNNPTYRLGTVVRGGVRVATEIEDGRGPVFGVGITPFGLEGLVKTGPRVQLFGAGAIGAIWFERDVPVANSRAFNYAFEVGGGVLWEYRPRRRFRFGYEFHHLSNNWTAEENPGLDADLFYVGWELAVGGGGAGKAR